MSSDKSKSADDSLDALLQGWAKSQELPDDQLQAMAERIGDMLADPVPLASQLPTTLSERVGSKRSRNAVTAWSTAALGLAAALLVAISLRQYWMGDAKSSGFNNEQRLAGETEDRGIREREAVSSSKTHLVSFSRQKQLIENLQSTTSQPIRWLAETDRELYFEFDESEDASKYPSQQSWLLIRLVVERDDMHADHSEQSAKPLWQVDLAVRSEQQVVVPSPSDEGETIAIWPYLTQDGMVMIDTRFQLNFPQRAEDNQSHLMRPGSRTKLAQIDDQLSLWQYVEVMNDADPPHS